MSIKTGFQKIKIHPITQIVVGFFIISFAYSVLQRLMSDFLINRQALPPDMGNMLATIVAALVALIVYILYFRVSDNRDIDELTTRHFLKNIFSGILIGFAVMSASILFIYLMGGYKINKINPASYLIPAFGISVGSGVYEELVFRGVLFRLTEKMGGTYVALVVSAFLFGFAHLSNPNSSLPAAIAISIEAGLLLGLAYVWKRNLWIPIGVHFMWNFTQAGIFGAPVSGFEIKSWINADIIGAEWFTGGDFGPEATLQTVIFCILISVFLFYFAKKRGNILPFPRKRKKPAISEEN